MTHDEERLTLKILTYPRLRVLLQRVEHPSSKLCFDIRFWCINASRSQAVCNQTNHRQYSPPVDNIKTNSAFSSDEVNANAVQVRGGHRCSILDVLFKQRAIDRSMLGDTEGARSIILSAGYRSSPLSDVATLIIDNVDNLFNSLPWARIMLMLTGLVQDHGSPFLNILSTSVDLPVGFFMKSIDPKEPPSICNNCEKYIKNQENSNAVQQPEGHTIESSFFIIM